MVIGAFIARPFRKDIPMFCNWKSPAWLGAVLMCAAFSASALATEDYDDDRWKTTTDRELATAMRRVREIYGPELRATRSDRDAEILYDQLIRDARATKVPANYYALLQFAAEVAARQGDLNQVHSAQKEL